MPPSLGCKKVAHRRMYFVSFPIRGLVCVAMPTFLECGDNRNQAVRGVKFLHFSKFLAWSNRFLFLLYW